jgi:hypothetical protein
MIKFIIKTGTSKKTSIKEKENNNKIKEKKKANNEKPNL